MNLAQGKAVSGSDVFNGLAATDGNATRYSHKEGFAYFRWPGHLQVDLGKPEMVECIRLLLFDGLGEPHPKKDDRRYWYDLRISRDGDDWTLLHSSGPKGDFGWQDFALEPAAYARYIRVEGKRNSANEYFHIVQVEAYPNFVMALRGRSTAGVRIASVEVRRASSAPGLEAQVPQEQNLRKPPRAPIRMPEWGPLLRPNTAIDCYQLIAPLGKGHSAQVWMARVLTPPPGVSLSPDDIVALKIYNAPMGSGSLRIQREYLVASSVEHTNLAKVYDVMIAPSRPWHNFLAMEYVQGQTLKQYVFDHGTPETALIVRVGVEILAALDALHAAGAFHRDVKPANVMLIDENQGRIKVMDLGIVSVASDDPPADLTGSSFLGSKHYAAFEQLQNAQVDARSDIYSVGAVLYYLYTGREPYRGAGSEVAIGLRMRERSEEVVARAAADAGLASFINQCLSTDRTRRPLAASAAADQLRSLIRP